MPPMPACATRVLTTAAAAALLSSLTTGLVPGSPADGAVAPHARSGSATPVWRLDTPAQHHPVVATTPAGDVYTALPEGQSGTTAVSRLHPGTGETVWQRQVPGLWYDVRADGPRDRVVLSTGLRTLALAGDGAVAWQREDGDAGRLLDLEVDPASGRSCTLVLADRYGPGVPSWVTRCLDADGTPLLRDTWTAPAGKKGFTDLAVDPRSGRIHLAGTAQPAGPRRRGDHLVVLRILEADGRVVRETRMAPGRSPDRMRIALDEGRGRVHLVGVPGRSGAPVQLLSFSREGVHRFTRRWRHGSHDAGAAAHAVDRRGRVLVATTGPHDVQLRTYHRSGRLLRKARRPLGDEGLPQLAIDPRRGRAHVLLGDADRKRVPLVTWKLGGRKVGRLVVDRGRWVEAAHVEVVAGTGSVVTVTGKRTSGPERQRVSLVRP